MSPDRDPLFVGVVGGGLAEGLAADRRPPRHRLFAERIEQFPVSRPILSVRRRVNEGVDDAGGPRQDGRNDVEGGEGHTVVNHVTYHQR